MFGGGPIPFKCREETAPPFPFLVQKEGIREYVDSGIVFWRFQGKFAPLGKSAGGLTTVLLSSLPLPQQYPSSKHSRRLQNLPQSLREGNARGRADKTKPGWQEAQ